MSTLDPLIEGYLTYLLEVGRKVPRTVVDVRCTLKRTVEGFSSRRPGVALWKLALEDYLHWFELEREAGRSDASLAKNASHLRGLLEYAWRSGRSERNVLDGLNLHESVKRRAPNFLTLEQAERLVHTSPRRSAVERRNRLIILLLYGCGLRTAELCALDVGDVVRERQELTVRQTKGDRPRVLPIPDGVYSALLGYLLDQGKRGALFRTAHRGRRIRSLDVCECVRAAVARAGLESTVTARTLRHTFATHLMDRGVDLAVIASLMGHRSPHETGVYLHALPGRAEAAVRTLKLGE
ncbi:MAG TPA: tyrosine-type recombinase/integrase [Steroidobacteraceae bacterium]|nr:tyrosine-type recombinase/integrase [Steroidobacteraceae bacterium]